MRRETLTRRQMLTLMSAPLTVLGSGAFTEAHAQTFWRAVGDVRIGGVHFSVGVHSSPDRRYRRRPGYYYQTKHHLRHNRHRCGPYCYGQRGYVYHHESCALLGAHIDYYGAPPAHYAPSYWGFDVYRYDYGRPYYDRHYDRHRGQKRGRGRGHQRGRGRGHW